MASFIRGRFLFEGGFYSKRDFIRWRILFEGFLHPRAAFI